MAKELSIDDVQAILNWRNFNVQFLAVEMCIDDLKNAVPHTLIKKNLSERLVSRGLACKEQFINTAEMAHFIAELAEKFITLCDSIEKNDKA